MFYRRECSIFYLLFNGIFCGIISNLQIHPPTPAKFGLNPDAYIGSGSRSRSFTSKNEGFEWEESGFFEGDIMTYKTDSRNGLLNEDFRWANATIPFYIEEKHFEDEQIEIILESIKEFNEKTCVRFRPFMKTDDHWVIITGKARGCWSPVGMKGQGGQQLNINSKKCLRKGTIMHEMLHSAGFFHQQSAADRDKFVKINWENIVDGHEGNFNKFDSDKITNYGIEYDYNSIMHYSGKAFSKNGNDTIESLDKTVDHLGQRRALTEKDIAKLNKMYEADCNVMEPEMKFVNFTDWFKKLFV